MAIFLVTASPAAAETIGHSVDGAPITARQFGDADAKRSMLVVGSIHGDEAQGHRVVHRFIRSYARRAGGIELWTIQTLNPDGVAAGTRGNAHGVDLNRNFGFDWKPIPPTSGYYSGPHAFSEPETRAMRRFLRRERPELTVWYHQPWGRTLIPCNRRSREVALRYARLSGLKKRDCDPSPPGAATGWQTHAVRAQSFVVELPGRALRGHEVRRHVEALATIARRRRSLSAASGARR